MRCVTVRDDLYACLISERQQSDHKGAATLLPTLPDAQVLIGDKGYDSDRFRESLKHRNIQPCIPSRVNRKTPASYDKTLYKQRHQN